MQTTARRTAVSWKRNLMFSERTKKAEEKETCKKFNELKWTLNCNSEHFCIRITCVLTVQTQDYNLFVWKSHHEWWRTIIK
jgi:hypothetical protein